MDQSLHGIKWASQGWWHNGNHLLFNSISMTDRWVNSRALTAQQVTTKWSSTENAPGIFFEELRHTLECNPLPMIGSLQSGCLNMNVAYYHKSKFLKYHYGQSQVLLTYLKNHRAFPYHLKLLYSKFSCAWNILDIFQLLWQYIIFFYCETEQWICHALNVCYKQIHAFKENYRDLMESSF